MTSPDTQEIWKPIPGWEDRYEVSDRGRVRSLYANFKPRKQPRLMMLFREDSGYSAIVLKGFGCIKRHRIHRLVLLAFVGPCPDGQQARHLNDQPSDNRLMNLCWGTPKENKADARKNGGIASGERHGRSKLSWAIVREIRERVAAGEARELLASEFGIGYQQVGNIVRGDSWKEEN